LFQKKITTANVLLDSISENILRVSNIGQPKRQQRLFVMPINGTHLAPALCLFTLLWIPGELSRFV
jgi:hypothetical protein